jgi:hypothetical protein
MNTKFEVGQELAVRSLGDWDCVYRFTVVSRTAKFVTLNYYGEPKRVGIKTDNEGEYCYPLGSYSMAPRLRCSATVQAVTA